LDGPDLQHSMAEYSDIPESSPERLKAMRRVGRPPLGDEPRRLIAIRVDPSVLESFRKEARRRHVGYQTLINDVLEEHIPQGRRVERPSAGATVPMRTRSCCGRRLDSAPFPMTVAPGRLARVVDLDL
jgi:uncharacterized protein (DUF4415 family)